MLGCGTLPRHKSVCPTPRFPMPVSSSPCLCKPALLLTQRMTRLTVAELPTPDGRPAIYIIFNVSDFLHICPYAETHRVYRLTVHACLHRVAVWSTSAAILLSHEVRSNDVRRSGLWCCIADGFGREQLAAAMWHRLACVTGSVKAEPCSAQYSCCRGLGIGSANN